MTYFRLANDVLLVDEGEDKAAIYDVPRRRIWLLNRHSKAVVALCERNLPLDTTLTNRDMLLLRRLEREDLGYFDSAPAYVDRLLLHQPVRWRGICKPAPRLHEVRWSITAECDLACNFCKQQPSVASWRSCRSCLSRRVDSAPAWIPQAAEAVVQQIALLGASCLHLRGGNPLLSWELLRDIVWSARRRSLSVSITTPCTGQNPETIVEFCVQNDIRLNVVTFGHNDVDSSRVCGRTGVLRHQERVIELLSLARLPFCVTVLVSPQSVGIRDTLKAVSKRWHVVPRIAAVHPADFDGKPSTLRDVVAGIERLSEWRDADEFYSRVAGESCTEGGFEIGVDGKIRSCAGLDRVYGDVWPGLVAALGESKILDSRDHVEETLPCCRKCVLRYACFRCEAFQETARANPTLMRTYCVRGCERRTTGKNSRNVVSVRVLNI